MGGEILDAVRWWQCKSAWKVAFDLAADFHRERDLAASSAQFRRTHNLNAETCRQAVIAEIDRLLGVKIGCDGTSTIMPTCAACGFLRRAARRL
jgi:hypothetical protein